MAVMVPPGVDGLLDVVVGQSWPQGDEDALRACADAWNAALAAVGGLAGYGDSAALQAAANISAASAAAFGKYWDQYTKGDSSTMGQLAAQCQAQAAALVGQANEVEYTKLSIVFLLIVLAIQILMAIAAAVPTLGGSLTEIPVATLITREGVLILAQRLIQMVLVMLVPDVISQAVMKAQGREDGWDWSKTVPAAENALLAGTIGALLGPAVEKLPWMGEDLAAGIPGKIIAGLTHIGEGGAVNVATALTTGGTQLAAALHSGNPADIKAAEQQLSLPSLLKQAASGGLLAGIFYLPGLARPGGTPVTFNAPDNRSYQVFLPDADLAGLKAGTLPAGFRTPVYNEHGARVTTATIDGPGVTFDRPLHGQPATTLAGGFTSTGHDGTSTWAYPPGARPGDTPVPLTYSATAKTPTTITLADGTTHTAPAGSLIHYTADTATPDEHGNPAGGTIFRVDSTTGPTTTIYQAKPPDTLDTSTAAPVAGSVNLTV
ncbi:MAG: hypothetical protein M3Y33_08980 [Actinomycetota bacterium]|nr:hypothetical protein [Actinomycetota bacterium]